MECACKWGSWSFTLILEVLSYIAPQSIATAHDRMRKSPMFKHLTVQTEHTWAWLGHFTQLLVQFESCSLAFLVLALKIIIVHPHMRDMTIYERLQSTVHDFLSLIPSADVSWWHLIHKWSWQNLQNLRTGRTTVEFIAEPRWPFNSRRSSLPSCHGLWQEFALSGEGHPSRARTSRGTSRSLSSHGPKQV